MVTMFATNLLCLAVQPHGAVGISALIKDQRLATKRCLNALGIADLPVDLLLLEVKAHRLVELTAPL